MKITAYGGCCLFLLVAQCSAVDFGHNGNPWEPFTKLVRDIENDHQRRRLPSVQDLKAIFNKADTRVESIPGPSKLINKHSKEIYYPVWRSMTASKKMKYIEKHKSQFPNNVNACGTCCGGIFNDKCAFCVKGKVSRVGCSKQCARCAGKTRPCGTCKGTVALIQSFGENTGYEKLLKNPEGGKYPIVKGDNGAIIIFGSGYHIVNGFRVKGQLPAGVVSDGDKDSRIDPKVTVADVIASVNNATSVAIREDPVLDELIHAIHLLRDDELRERILKDLEDSLGKNRMAELTELRTPADCIAKIQKDIKALREKNEKSIEAKNYDKLVENKGNPKFLQDRIKYLIGEGLQGELQTRKKHVTNWLRTLTDKPESCCITFIRNFRRYDMRLRKECPFVKPSWVAGLITHWNTRRVRDRRDAVKYVIDIGSKKIALTAPNGTQPIKALNKDLVKNDVVITGYEPKRSDCEKKSEKRAYESMMAYLKKLKEEKLYTKETQIIARFTGKFRAAKKDHFLMKKGFEKALNKMKLFQHGVLSLEDEGIFGSKHAFRIAEAYFGESKIDLLVMELGGGSHQGALYQRRWGPRKPRHVNSDRKPVKRQSSVTKNRMQQGGTTRTN